MRSSLARSATTLLLAHSLFASIVCGQTQSSTEQSRPRRVQPEWQAPVAASPIAGVNISSLTGPEPTIRVALTTDAHSAVISTTSHLFNASSGDKTMVALDVSRIRVEPRLLSPLPAANADALYRVLVSGSASREEADENGKEIKKSTGEEVQPVYDAETKTWGLLVGVKQPREEAEELRARLEEDGLEASLSGPPLVNQSNPGKQTSTGPALPSTNNNVRLTLKPSSPSREVVALSPNAGRLFSSSAPVAFVSDNEQTAPVRFNDRPYRGRIEVFTNLRGNLTVVNELGLEDYVKGVVANELSPGGYPAIEALKAQAVAARTYAVKNRGQFISQGFDILPTTRSQVYRGLSSEQSLSSRAVDETRGLIATYNGEPINAFYTSTCGGRTENSENIFNEAIPYLRSRECAVEGPQALAPFTIRTTREPPELHDESNVPLARDIGLLTTQNFSYLNNRASDSWLSGAASAEEVRIWLANVARIAHQIAPTVTEDVNRPPAFATALATAVFGESRASTLLNEADVNYFLAVRDGQEVPRQNRADLALLIRDGYLTVYPDATIRTRESLSRARVLHAMAKALEARNLLQLQKGNARPAIAGQLIVRSTRGKDQPIKVGPDAFLFRAIGENFYGVRSIALVGGEPVMFHVSGAGEIDYLEVKPAPNGASAERMSPYTNWTRELSLGQVQARLARAASGIGPITDLRVASRGESRRVIDLEIIGSNGTAHVRGGRIRSSLGLREQLFVIDREFDDSGRVTGFVFTGRGWGHGVGMCQVGAYGLARQGLTYEQILKAFYTGIEVTKIY